MTIAARKSIKNAKTLLQKAQLEKLIPTVCITPEKGFNNYISSATKAKLLTASKNQVLTNSTNKLQTMGTPMTGPFKVRSKIYRTIISSPKKKIFCEERRHQIFFFFFFFWAKFCDG